MYEICNKIKNIVQDLKCGDALEILFKNLVYVLIDFNFSEHEARSIFNEAITFFKEQKEFQQSLKGKSNEEILVMSILKLYKNDCI